MNNYRILDKLSSYVSMLTDEDTRVNKNHEYKEEISNLSSNF